MASEWLLTNCYMYPGTKWFMGREELKRLMASSYLTWCKVCKYHEIPQEDWKLNGQYNYIEFANGSRIDLLDLKYIPSDPLYERFGSLEYTGGWIEEAGEIDFKAFDILKSRIGRQMNEQYNLPAKMLITCNPKKNWLYLDVYRPWKEDRLPKQYAFIQALYRDNPYTALEYGKSLMEIKDQAMKQRLMFGDWEYDNDPSALLEYDAICDIWTNKTQDGKKYLTIDVARQGKDKTVVRRWEGWQVKEVYTWDKNFIDTLQREVAEICNKHQIPRSQVIADEDGVGGGFVDNFKCKGFVNNSSAIQPAIVDRDPNRKQNYANLKTQCAYILADKINRREIGEDDQSYRDETIQELEQLKRDKLEKEGKISLMPKDEIKEAIGRSPDHLDSLIMRAWFDIGQSGGGTSALAAMQRLREQRQTKTQYR